MVSTEPNHEDLTGTHINETVVWSGEYYRVIARSVVIHDDVKIGQIHIPQRRDFDVDGNPLGWGSLDVIADPGTRERAYRLCLVELLKALTGGKPAFVPPSSRDTKVLDAVPVSDDPAQAISGYYSRDSTGAIEHQRSERALDQGRILVEIQACLARFISQTNRVPDTIFLPKSHLRQAARETAFWTMSDFDESSLRLTTILGMRIVEVEIERPVLALALEAPRQDATTAVAAYYQETRR